MDDDVTPEKMMAIIKATRERRKIERLSYNGNSNDHGNGGNTCSESDVDSQAYEEEGNKEDNEEEEGSKEEEDNEVFIERLYNMVDLDDLLDNAGVEARESVESEARVSVESEARESVESVKDLSGGTNEALHVNEALELHIRRSGGTNEALELQDRNEMSKRVKGSDDEQFLFDRGRAADSVVKQQQVEQQQARESAGIEEKWQSGRCRFEMQVCDSTYRRSH
jgi:hypothetical protein